MHGSSYHFVHVKHSQSKLSHQPEVVRSLVSQQRIILEVFWRNSQVRFPFYFRYVHYTCNDLFCSCFSSVLFLTVSAPYLLVTDTGMIHVSKNDEECR
jgi:hypothetical protein